MKKRNIKLKLSRLEIIELSVIVSSTGVLLLLLAFFLNLFELLAPDTKAYAILNFVGAGLFQVMRQFLLIYMPFVYSRRDIGVCSLCRFSIRLLKTHIPQYFLENQYLFPLTFLQYIQIIEDLHKIQ